jgi:DNA-binding MarR family transcriptional regulator
MAQDRTINLDSSVGYLLKAASVALRSAMEAALKPLGLSVSEYSCLELLSQRPGLSNSELARGTFVTRQSSNVLLAGLAQRGLIQRPATARTGRVLPITLTAEGRDLATRASAAVGAVEDRMTAALDHASQSALRDGLRSCIAALA